MIITIDGPAGAGKSTVAKLLADRLGFRFLDTGAMYRAVTWAALKQGVDIHDHESVARIANEMELNFVNQNVIVNGHDVTSEIRTPYVTSGVSEIADNSMVRESLVHLLREIAADGNFVCEGRDQGTVVFPTAECKIFLTASPEERAARRQREMQNAGEDVSLDEVLVQQQERDRRDETRPVGRLLKADDAIEYMTDNKSLESIIEDLIEIAKPLIEA